MIAITHLFFSLLIGLLTYHFFNLNPVAFILIVLISGIFPDIDHPKSKIGRKLKILSYPINFIFGHRGLFHSLLLAIGFSAWELVYSFLYWFSFSLSWRCFNQTRNRFYIPF